MKDDEHLSQFGSRLTPASDGPFRNRLRPGERDMSLISGRVKPDEAIALISRHRKLAAPGEGVRYSTVGTLRAAGFSVTATPTRRNPRHVSVALDQTWTDDRAKLFDECFTETEWKEGER